MTLDIEKIKAAIAAAKNALSHDTEYEQFDEIVTPSAVHELITRLEAAEKDAARYRWLRNAKNQLLEDDPCVSDDCFVTYYDSELDDTIDRLINRNATMKESEK